MYYLMNKNKPMLKLNIVNNSIKIVDEIVPLPRYLNSPDTWIVDRLNPVPRESIYMILKKAGINTLEDFDREMKAVSVTDTFWIKSDRDNYTWEKVSPHQNRLSLLAADIILNKGYIVKDIRSPSPDFKVGGTADKFWKRINNRLYLYKTNGTITNGKYPYMTIRPYCEYYAAQVAERLKIPSNYYIQYKLNANIVPNEGLKPYLYCEAFTNENIGYMPLVNTEYSRYRIDQLFKAPIASTDRDREIIASMIMLDAIIVNIDRHTENYGFIINNNTLNIMGFAPIFDQDCSLGALQRVEDGNIRRAYIELITTNRPKMGFKDFISQGKYMLKYYNFRERLKAMMPFKFERLSKSIDLPDERVHFMEYIVNNQINAILKQ